MSLKRKFKYHLGLWKKLQPFSAVYLSRAGFTYMLLDACCWDTILEIVQSIK